MFDLQKDNAKSTAKHNNDVKLQSTLNKNRNLFANVKKLIDNLGEDWTPELSKKLLGLSTEGEVQVEEHITQFPMPDGSFKAFMLITIKPEDIEEKTISAENINDRDQNALNEESLSDILETLGPAGNFYPGVSNVIEGILHVLDGSRRRYSCLLKKVPFRTYVPVKDNITFAEAKYIADISELQKPLSYREKGVKYLKIMEKEKFNEVIELAEYLKGNNYNASFYETLRLQIKYAKIPSDFISLIPEYNSLSVREFKILDNVYSYLIDNPDKKEQLLNDINKVISDCIESKPDKLAKQSVAEINKLFLAKYKVKKNENKAITTPLVRFDDKYKSASKVEKGRNIQFKLSRISSEKINKIEQFIIDTLKED